MSAWRDLREVVPLPLPLPEMALGCMGLSAGVCDPRTIRADGYERRRPEEPLLYRVVHEYWPAFRELAEERGGLPSVATREFDECLPCGILEHGRAPVLRALRPRDGGGLFM